MTDEIVKEEKNCECPFCKIVKCECCKKFLLVVLGSFIGCSLAILLFAPKPPKMPCPRFMPNGPMMERQLPPPAPYMHHKDFRGEFRGEHRLPNGEFRHKIMREHKDFGDRKPEFPRQENAE